MVCNQFATKLKSIPLALSALKRYISETKHAPVHIKLVYNVFDEKTFIEGTFSSDVPTTEITSDLTSSISFILSNMVSAYLMTYQKVFLSRIIINADIDMLGIVYDSIKVTCRFKANNVKYAISNDNLLSSILNQTMEAERSEIIERPATGLSIQLFRHRLRSIQIISDYSSNDQYDSYQHPFESEILVSLMGIIKLYENPENSHQASARLFFDLSKRNRLLFKHGTIYPSESLIYHSNKKDHFEIEQIDHVLSQTVPILATTSLAQIDNLELFMTHNRQFKCRFGLTAPQDKNVPVKNFMNMSTDNSVITWQNVFNHIVSNYSLSQLSEAWLQDIVVTLSPFKDQWVVNFDQYSLTHNFNSYLPKDQIVAMVQSVAEQSNGKARIKHIVLEKEEKKTEMLRLDLEPLAVKPKASAIAMPLPLRNVDTDGKVIHYFDLSDHNGYFLSHDKFMKMVK